MVARSISQDISRSLILGLTVALGLGVMANPARVLAGGNHGGSAGHSGSSSHGSSAGRGGSSSSSHSASRTFGGPGHSSGGLGGAPNSTSRPVTHNPPNSTNSSRTPTGVSQFAPPSGPTGGSSPRDFSSINNSRTATSGSSRSLDRAMGPGPREGTSSAPKLDATNSVRDRSNLGASRSANNGVGVREIGNGNLTVHTAGYRGVANNSSQNATLGNLRTGGVNANIANRLPGEFSGTAGLTPQGNGHHCQSFSQAHLHQHCNQIRGHFYQGGFCNSGWYGSYFSPWWPGVWYGNGLGSGLSYGGLCGFCGLSPVAYPLNYGANVVYAGDQVLVNGDAVGTPAEYYKQVARVAATGNDAPLGSREEWQALGLFALSKNQESEATSFVQLAVNQDGLIRGNHYNSVLNMTLPVTGSIDKKTQRAAWTVGEKSKAVFEAGAKNLTQEQATCLVHFNDRQTEQLIMTRLQEPQKSPVPEEK